MALLPSATHCNSNTSYYALATDAGGAVERAEAFIAQNATPGVAGFFAACGDGSGATDAELFEMRTGGIVANTLQWTMGMSGTPSGLSGNNFVITAYDGDGAPLSTPLSIERATGIVNFSVNPTVAGVALQQSQTDFVQSITVPLLAEIPEGKSYQVDMSGVFQVPKTGLYMIEAVISFNGAFAADQFVCGEGDFFDFNLQPQPTAPGVFSGGVSVDVTPVIPSTAPLPLTATDRTWSNTSIVKLTGGYNYQAILFGYNLSNSMEATGSATLVATVEITALCS